MHCLPGQDARRIAFARQVELMVAIDPEFAMAYVGIASTYLPIGRWAELWHEGQLVCRRGRDEGGSADYWTID